MRRLVSSKELQIFETGKGTFPRIDIQGPIGRDQYEVRVCMGAESRIASFRSDHHDDEHRDSTLAVRAHSALGMDILVTGCPWILSNMSLPVEAMTPRQVMPIMGFHMRSQGDFRVDSHFFLGKDYYFYLARLILSNLWKYHGACCKAQGNLGGLSGAVLDRATRSLEARDLIGFALNNAEPGAQGTMEYHFDYLMLLLAGAIDAQADVASRVYGMPTKGGGRKFHLQDFQNALKGKGAVTLLEVVKRHSPILSLLVQLRNTIHRDTMGHVHINRISPDAFYLETDDSIQPCLNVAAQARPEFERVILRRGKSVLIDPYPFSDLMVRYVFDMINSVAEATDVLRLLQNDVSERDLQTEPPEDFAGGRPMWDQIIMLGW